MRISAVPHPDGQLPSLSALVAPEGDVRHSDAVAYRFAGGRPPTVRELAESRNCREYRPAYPPVARIAQHDAEPATSTLTRFAVIFVADRKWSDDAQSRHARKNCRSAGSWIEPFLRSRDERRDGA